MSLLERAVAGILLSRRKAAQARERTTSQPVQAQPQLTAEDRKVAVQLGIPLERFAEARRQEGRP